MMWSLSSSLFMCCGYHGSCVIVLAYLNVEISEGVTLVGVPTLYYSLSFEKI